MRRIAIFLFLSCLAASGVLAQTQTPPPNNTAPPADNTAPANNTAPLSNNTAPPNDTPAANLNQGGQNNGGTQNGTQDDEPPYDPAEDDCWQQPAADHAQDLDAAGRSANQIDCRGSFEASFYIGGAVDTFSGSEMLQYLNPGETGKSTLREVAGFDFAYRLYGTRSRLNPGQPKVGWLEGSQLWVYGETVHGVRSKELECQTAAGAAGEHANLPTCNQTPDPNVPGTDQLLAILRSATSLEAFMGFRWEFAPLSMMIQGSELDRARFYLKGQIGAINVAGGGDSADQHQLALGAIAVSGPLEGSYLEFGHGRNDLMVKNHDSRFKFDGFLSVDPRAVPLLGWVNDPRIRPFAQLTVDVDFGGGADSLQTYFGFDYTFGGKRRVRRAPNTNTNAAQ